MNDAPSPPLPDVFKATLTREQYETYRAEVEANAESLTVRQRGATGDVQLRYRRNGREFIDTVLQREDRFELIRM